MRDYAEIVKALRLCSAVNSSCEECPCNDPADDLCECANKVSIAAADAIENLLTENAALRRMIENLTDEKAALVKELHDSKSELSAAIDGQKTVTNRNAFDAPLALDELHRMDGEPVWVEFQDGSGGCWGIVHITVFNHIVFANGLFCTIGKPYYGKTWLPYREKPKED